MRLFSVRTWCKPRAGRLMRPDGVRKYNNCMVTDRARMTDPTGYTGLKTSSVSETMRFAQPPFAKLELHTICVSLDAVRHPPKNKKYRITRPTRYVIERL